MNSNMKYTRPINTIGYLSITKKKDIYKNNPTKNNYRHNYMEYVYKNGDINNVLINNNYNHLSKVLSQKKHKGEHEMNSYVNQNMLINNDLDRRLAHISKKINKLNKEMLKKNGSAKLVIEKVESQLPSRNEEFYKFTNQRRPYDINDNLFNKQNIDDDQNIIDNHNYLVQEYQYQNGLQQSPFRYQNLVKNYSPNKKQKSSHSTKNIFKSNTSNHFYTKGKTYNNQNMHNKSGVNKDAFLLSKSPQYIRGLNEIKYETYEPQYLIFENDSNKVYSFNPETSPIHHKINNMKFSYMNKNDNLRYKIDMNKDQKQQTLYDNYKDLMKMNTFSVLRKKKDNNNIKNKNNNNNHYNYNINIQKIAQSQPEIDEKIIKIQSLWRGAYVRELMNFYWNLTEFKDLLNKVLMRKNFTYFQNLLKNYQEPGSKTSSNDRIILRKRCKLSNKENEEKTKEDDTRNLEEFKKLLNQRKEDYDDLTKKYNSLMERCSELQQIIDHNNENKNSIWKDLIVEKYNFNVANVLKNIEKNDNIINQKKFDIINPEQKEVFNIIQQKKFGKINPEQKETFNIIQQKKFGKINPEQKETFNIIQQKKFGKINPEQKETFNIIQQKKLKEVSPKQNETNNNNQTKKFDIINPEQKETFNIIQQKKLDIVIPKPNETDNNNQPKKKFDTINPEQKETFNIIQEKKLETIIPKPNETDNNNQQKKFDTINPEQKESFNIIQQKKFNAINPEQKEAFNIIQQKTNVSNNEINKIKQDNNNKHKSHLDIITADQFIIESNKLNESSFEIFNYELSLINDKKEKFLILDINHCETLNIINTKNEKEKEKSKPLILEIKNCESLNLISNKKEKSHLLEVNKCETFELINNITSNQNTALNKKETETKAEIETKAEKVNNKKYELMTEKQINLNIEIKASEQNKKEEEKKELQILLTESVDQFIIENEEEDTENNRSSCKEKSLIVCENDKFSLLKNDTKKDNKNIKYDFEFVVVNNDVLFISKVKKQQCNKMTEITEELNGIEPNNHYELILQGKIKSTNNNNIINEKDQNEKSSIGKNDNIANKNRNINYNINNEIEKGNCLEINTIELKRTNIGSFNVVRTDNNNSVLTEKAKNNLIKIILPIRIKTTLKDFIHRSIFPLLINNLKKIAYYSKNVGVKVNDNNDNNDNKDKNAHHDDNDIHQEGMKKIKHKMSKFYSGKIEENTKDTSNNKSVMENNKK